MEAKFEGSQFWGRTKAIQEGCRGKHRKAESSALDWTRDGHSKEQIISQLNLYIILDTVPSGAGEPNTHTHNHHTNKTKGFQDIQDKPPSQLTILIPLVIQLRCHYNLLFRSATVWFV